MKSMKDIPSEDLRSRTMMEWQPLATAEAELGTTGSNEPRTMSTDKVATADDCLRLQVAGILITSLAGQ